VGIAAQADRVLSREEVVELADAVAAFEGIASGIGTERYGARLIVEADSRREAIEAATRRFTAAVAQAGLPEGPIVTAEAVSEYEDDEDSTDQGSDPPNGATPGRATPGRATPDGAG
jgi:hypothetical protein